jgi:hypothetical protein
MSVSIYRYAAMVECWDWAAASDESGISAFPAESGRRRANKAAPRTPPPLTRSATAIEIGIADPQSKDVTTGNDINGASGNIARTSWRSRAASAVPRWKLSAFAQRRVPDEL